MKALTLKTILLCLLTFINTNPQGFVKDFYGIPLITYAPHDVDAYQFDYIKAMGIDVIIASNVTTQRLLEIKNRGMQVIAWQVDTTVYDPNFNYILKYTDARYSVWEAEGTNPKDGGATLIYNKEIGEPYQVNNSVEGIITKKNAREGELVSGPGYRQEAHYRGIDLSRLIKYRATARLKLIVNQPSRKNNPEDILCQFQVTNSLIRWNRIEGNKVINEKNISLKELKSGKWKDIEIDYDLSILNPPKPESKYFPSAGWAEFVDFKIIWSGNPNYRLVVDKIIVSDEFGREIVTPKFQQLIAEQDKHSFSTKIDDTIVGWYGIDEPESIDNYEPIRIVDSVLDKSSDGKRRLWISFPSSWNGKYGDSNLGAEPLFKWNEFQKRVKRTLVQNNHSIFDYPLTKMENPFGGDFRKRNIEIFTDSVLSVIQDEDSLFCLCLQGGRYDLARLFKDPSPKDILYTANLGLMYGAKALTIYRYFGEGNNLKHSGLVNYTTKDGYIFTDKYYFFKDVLSPRLKGEFGKTLKLIKQTEQFPGLDLIINESVDKEFVKSIEPLNYKSNDTSIVELGFFRDWNDSNLKYFMLVNRYYSSTKEFKFTLQSFIPNSYYEIKDLVDNISLKIKSTAEGMLIFEDLITPGDGRLYKIKSI